MGGPSLWREEGVGVDDQGWQLHQSAAVLLRWQTCPALLRPLQLAIKEEIFKHIGSTSASPNIFSAIAHCLTLQIADLNTLHTIHAKTLTILTNLLQYEPEVVRNVATEGMKRDEPDMCITSALGRFFATGTNVEVMFSVTEALKLLLDSETLGELRIFSIQVSIQYSNSLLLLLVLLSSQNPKPPPPPFSAPSSSSSCRFSPYPSRPPPHLTPLPLKYAFLSRSSCSTLPREITWSTSSSGSLRDGVSAPCSTKYTRSKHTSSLRF